jgi:tetrapyrrole methylase family protein/MazG family protein
MQTIIALGLGPGRWEDLTLEAQDILAAATTIYVRTLRHPVVTTIQRHYPHLIIHSFDHLYDTANSWDTLYPAIANKLCTLAKTSNEPLVYAVPGHPLIGEKSVQLLQARAQAEGIALRVVAGLSYIEPVLAALGIDPFTGLQLLDAAHLAGLQRGELASVLQPSRPALIAQIHHHRLAGALKTVLTDLYPHDWAIQIVLPALPQDEPPDSMPSDAHPSIRIISLPLHMLDRSDVADDIAMIYLPPLPPLAALRTAETLRYIVARLRGPDGCPWDRQQTHRSLKPFVLEEAYEVADTLEHEDTAALAEELGDLLLQVYLHAEIARQDGNFTLEDVFEHIARKLIRRHPHVFGNLQVRDAAHVIRNWEEIKRTERQARGEDVASESALRPIPLHTPALACAYELQRQAAEAGFAWTDKAQILAKIAEELAEFTQADARKEEELGDLLFALVGLAHRHQINPEDALRAANHKFRQRFQRMEALARTRGQRLATLTPAEWRALWHEARQT